MRQSTNRTRTGTGTGTGTRRFVLVLVLVLQLLVWCLCSFGSFVPSASASSSASSSSATTGADQAQAQNSDVDPLRAVQWMRAATQAKRKGDGEGAAQFYLKIVKAAERDEDGTSLRKVEEVLGNQLWKVYFNLGNEYSKFEQKDASQKDPRRKAIEAYHMAIDILKAYGRPLQMNLSRVLTNLGKVYSSFGGKKLAEATGVLIEACEIEAYHFEAYRAVQSKPFSPILRIPLRINAHFTFVFAFLPCV